MASHPPVGRSVPTKGLNGRDIIVIGGSAGGIEATSTILSALPENFPAAVFVVVHIAPEAPSSLVNILARRTELPVALASDRAAIQRGHVYVARPDHHLLLHRGYMRVMRGPRENRHRPAIDPLFRTAARSYGSQVIAVLLSGFLDDGTAGLRVVRDRGGITIVQDPEDAKPFYPMPQNAVQYARPNHVVPMTEIAPLLVRLVSEPVEAAPRRPVPVTLQKESQISELDMSSVEDDDKPGTPSVYTCPECQGVLWEIEEGDVLRFRCRVGHAYSANSLLTAKSEALENALWTALRSLEETAAMARRMAERAKEHNHTRTGARLLEEAAERSQQAALIRDLLLSNENLAPTGTEQ